MKKMTKGAIVTGLGVALLLGGGGTLAVWNADQTAKAGEIVAGNLNLTAHKGTWTSDLSGEIHDITAYRVVPGETLEFKQPVTVALEGNQMRAELTITGAPDNGFKSEDVEISEVTLTNDDHVTTGDELTPATNGAFTARTSFKFKHREDQGRSSVKSSYDLSRIGYKLEQLHPVAPTAG